MKEILHVMIVDDDDDDRDMFCEAVGKVSARTKCFHAINGLEALELLKASTIEKPDLIFLDLNMPKLNGKQCLQLIKQTEGINNIPVYMYSTSNLLEDKEETRQLGASGFIHKPTSFDALCKEISSAFSV